MGYQDIIDFWFSELSPKDWWIKDEKLDHMIFDRFSHVHNMALRGELFHWRETPEGRLAEIIILDQFSRNMFRGRSDAFAADPIALVLAQEMISRGEDKKIDIEKRAFCYMPLMHSESKIIHQTAEVIFKQPSLENAYDYELKHKAIIDRFGRYPHRNKALGRESTEEEIEFLKQPASCF